MVVQRNRPGYDQGKTSLDQRILSMASHNHRRRVGSTLPPTVEMLLQKENFESVEWTYNIESLYQTLQHSHVHPSFWTPTARFVESLTSLQQALEAPVTWIPGQYR